MITRRNFPQVGEYAAVSLPRHPETGQMMEEWGINRMTAILLRAHSNPLKTCVTTVKRQQSFSGLGSLVAAPKIEKLDQRIHSQMKARFINVDLMPEFRAIVDIDATYVVLGLRKCLRGNPMLPNVGVGGTVSAIGSWEQREWMPLAAYLQEFLARLGVDVRVYDVLDDLCLVPYQAVLRRDLWQLAWQAFKAPWQEQRAAYRRLLGGKYAPELKVDVRPNFTRLGQKSTDCSVGMEPMYVTPGTSELASSHTNGIMPVRGTFVHFSTPAKVVRPRSDSQA